MFVQRKDFSESLQYPVNGVRALITSLFEQKKRYNFEKNAEKKHNLAIEYDVKKIETQKLLQSVKLGFSQVENELQNEYSQIMKEINIHRMELNDIIGFNDQVKGFDIEFMVDDQISFLDIYSTFLGDDYEKMKTDYRKAIEIMNETYKLKYERLELNEPVSEEEINQSYTEKEVERMMKIHADYIIGSQNRKKYMERIEIEFPNFPRDKIEMLDAFIEHKRWLKVQRKALFRDWEREKLELKQRTIKSIEDEIKETEERIAKELEYMKQESYVAKLHKNRDEKRTEYEEKLKVIKEIEEEKKLEIKIEKERCEQEYLSHCKEIKTVTNEYKEERQQKITSELEKMREDTKKLEEERKQQNLKNKPRVDEIRDKEEQKVKEKFVMLEEKRNYLQKRDERINKAIEEYSIRPQVERDSERVIQPTVANTLSKNVIMDKADKVVLFKNHGFTVENLMKDIRYKVSSALSSAGLATTNYAQNLMKGLETNLSVRKDMMSSNF